MRRPPIPSRAEPLVKKKDVADEAENHNGVLDFDGCFDLVGAESTVVPNTDLVNDGYIDEVDPAPTKSKHPSKSNTPL